MQWPGIQRRELYPLQFPRHGRVHRGNGAWQNEHRPTSFRSLQVSDRRSASLGSTIEIGFSDTLP
jgi:hypothetical protein